MEMCFMNKKLRIGVMGARRGETMMRVLEKHPDAELAAICDNFEPALKRAHDFCAEFGVDIKIFTDFDEFIQYDLDAVVLANFANEHAPFAVKAMKAGKHVLSEVLPCQNPAEAVELIEAVEETGLVYAYAENYCYMSDTFEMWRRYKNGDIGELHYAQCDYIHDCSADWISLTYGDTEHWRNHLCATFYCTHSLGPVLMTANLRPVQVTGFETPPMEPFVKVGSAHGHTNGIEMVVLENGAVVESVHGGLKRPKNNYYNFYGSLGYLGNLANDDVMCYYEDGTLETAGDRGTKEVYTPEPFVSAELRKSIDMESHGGSDFYATHFFIQKILGRPDGEWAIDVYKAVDMGLCGILAHRSLLNGNIPIKIPNLRNKEERDAYRNDRACTDKKAAGDSVLPVSAYPSHVYTDEEKAELKRLWAECDD